MNLKRQCVELLFECPAQRCDALCPFMQIRTQEDILVRVHWLKGKTASELRDLVALHTACSQRKTRSPTPSLNKEQITLTNRILP